MKELEMKHQNELILMQNEINKIRDDEINKDICSKAIDIADNSSSIANRKLVKGDLIFKHNQLNKTPISISYNNISQVF